MGKLERGRKPMSRKRRAAILAGPPVLLAVIVAGMVTSVALGAVLVLVLLTVGSAIVLWPLGRGYRGESIRVRSESAVAQIHSETHGVYFFKATAPHLAREGRTEPIEPQIERARRSLEEARRRLPDHRPADQPRPPRS